MNLTLYQFEGMELIVSIKSEIIPWERYNKLLSHKVKVPTELIRITSRFIGKYLVELF